MVRGQLLEIRFILLLWVSQLFGFIESTSTYWTIVAVLFLLFWEEKDSLCNQDGLWLMILSTKPSASTTGTAPMSQYVKAHQSIEVLVVLLSWPPWWGIPGVHHCTWCDSYQHSISTVTLFQVTIQSLTLNHVLSGSSCLCPKGGPVFSITRCVISTATSWFGTSQWRVASLIRALKGQKG